MAKTTRRRPLKKLVKTVQKARAKMLEKRAARISKRAARVKKRSES
jgi:hypothetical protein